MKLSTTVGLNLLALWSLAVTGAADASNEKDVAQLRRRIEKYRKTHRGSSAAAAKTTLDAQSRRTKGMPKVKTGVDWEAGSFTFGTFMKDTNGMRVRVNNGIMGRPIGIVKEKVPLLNGKFAAPMHDRADGGAVIAKDDGTGGFYYVSNSELGSAKDRSGGVYVFDLDANHDVMDYYQVLNGTVDNCAGGTTPWGTWVSCEEEDGYGRCWQVDPANKAQTGPTKSAPTAVTGYLGNWEGFAWDDVGIKGYVTEDAMPADAPGAYGCLNRFTPDAAAMACYNARGKAARWCTLNSGTVDYMKIFPDALGSNCGTIGWTKDPKNCDSGMFPGGEGIDITNQMMRFTAKVDQLWLEVDLKSQTYCKHSTLEGFPQQPDNIRFFGDVLYFCTDGLTPNGVYAYDGDGYYAILQEIDYNTEAAGISFSPDGMVMYVAFQEAAVWQFWRTDGKSFQRQPKDIKYIPENADFSTIQGTDIAMENIITDLIMEILEDEGLIK